VPPQTCSARAFDLGAESGAAKDMIDFLLSQGTVGQRAMPENLARGSLGRQETERLGEFS